MIKKYGTKLILALGAIKLTCSLAIDFAVDLVRFVKYTNGYNIFKYSGKAQACMLRLSHSLEKGLALPHPKPEFGREKCKTLLRLAEGYNSKFGHDAILEWSLSVVRAVCVRNDFKDVLNTLENSFALQTTQFPSPTRPQSKAAIAALCLQDPEAFFGGRRSVRQFAKKPIKQAIIERAIKIALSAPSVCNRQPTRVRTFTSSREIASALSLQDGNIGFTEEIGVLFLISYDTSAFFKAGERHQGYIDGGLFAMTLCLALHAMGLGTCFLNWSMSSKEDKLQRKALNIPDNESIVTFLAAGELRDDYVVAESPRREVDAIWLARV
jgi:nitroreductase